MDPISRSGSMLVRWELAVFMYASVKKKVRLEQWEELYAKSMQWGDKRVLGGDFNDIRNPTEKEGEGLGLRQTVKDLKTSLGR